MHIITCVILQALVLLSASKNGEAFFFNDLLKADVYPSDAIVFVGDTLKLWCQLKETAIPSISTSDLHFTVNTPTDVFRVAITPVNSSHGYALVNATNEIGGRNTFSCMSGDESFLSSTFVTVERRLRNVTNVLSVWDYSSDQTTISWDIGQEYFYLNGLHISADWNADGSSNFSNACIQSDANRCIIEDLHLPGTIFLRVTVAVRRREQFNNAQPYTIANRPAILQTTSIYSV